MAIPLLCLNPPPCSFLVLVWLDFGGSGENLKSKSIYNLRREKAGPN